METSSTEERIKKILEENPLLSSEKLRRKLKEEGLPGTRVERLYRNHRRSLGKED